MDDSRAVGGSEAARHWPLDPGVDFLNHGSFGACPTAVLAAQAEWRDRLEREPVAFMVRTLEPALDAARERLARLVGADPDDLAFVANATTGVSTVLASLDPAPGEELLCTDHAYNACRNALDRLAERSGARVVVVPGPFPLDDSGRVVEALVAAAGPRTRLALVDHVTSPTALVLPVARIVSELQARGVDVLVDGAHAPGQVELDLRALGAAYYTANAHKWLCAPKGAALLHVRRDRQARLRPLVTSHGRNSPRTDRSRFRLEFDWTGTDDPTPFLAVPAAIDFLEGLLPGGLPALRAANHALACRARRVLLDVLGIGPPAPEELLGAMASVPLPPGPLEPPPAHPWVEPLGERLFREGLELPVMTWPARPARLLRVSAQAYNAPRQYERLARRLAVALDEERVAAARA